MPVHLGKDKEGCYAQWGNSGKKYYYECTNKEAERSAITKAARQGRAIKAQEK